MTTSRKIGATGRAPLAASRAIGRLPTQSAATTSAAAAGEEDHQPDEQRRIGERDDQDVGQQHLSGIGSGLHAGQAQQCGDEQSCVGRLEQRMTSPTAARRG